MKNTKLMLVLLFLMTGTVMAQEPTVTPLISKDLMDIRGKELLMITVEYPPGGADPIHRHDSHAIVYVLEGSIVMQVKGEKEVTLTVGQTFYEGPNDVHLVGRNASNTRPAKFLVFIVKNQGAPVLVPVPEMNQQKPNATRSMSRKSLVRTSDDKRKVTQEEVNND